MNKFESIRIERDGHAAHLQLNRPERINALGKAMLLEIQAAMDALEADAEVDGGLRADAPVVLGVTAEVVNVGIERRRLVDVGLTAGVTLRRRRIR